MSTTEIVRFDAVSKTFGAGARAVTALAGLDLDIRRGEIFAIIGYSGAGKSTLVRLINGLERASGGRIHVDGLDITALREGELAAGRQRIGMIFQQFNLMRSRTVFGNIEFPLIAAGRPRAERRERVWELLEFVGLTQKAWAYPEQLSGGQKQRVGIARALADAPPLLLADEATSALDPETTQDVLALLKRVNVELGVTVVVITHEMEVVRRIADRVAVLDGGRVVEVGPVYDVFTAPAAPTTQRFLRTVLRDRPSDEVLNALRRTHPGRLVTAEIGPGTRLGDIIRSFATNGVGFEIAYGALEHLQGREFGSVTLELTGAADALDRAVARLAAHTRVDDLGSAAETAS